MAGMAKYETLRNKGKSSKDSWNANFVNYNHLGTKITGNFVNYNHLRTKVKTKGVGITFKKKLFKCYTPNV